MEEDRRPQEEMMPWWMFCEKNVKTLARIPTFEEHKAGVFEWLTTPKEDHE